MNERGDGWERMRGVLTRVAIGPKGSKDLTREEAREGEGEHASTLLPARPST